MTCRDLIDNIAPYLERELAWRIAINMRDHLKICGSCRSYLKSYRHSTQLARAAMYEQPTPPPDDWVMETVEKAVRF